VALRDWALCRIQIKTRDILKRRKFQVRKNKNKVSKHSTLKPQEKPLEGTHSSFTKNFFVDHFLVLGSRAGFENFLTRFSRSIHK
jgi:hypothetical protein